MSVSFAAAPYAGQPFRFCGREEAEAICAKYHVPSALSITDPGSAKPQVRGSEQTLSLRFYDVPRPHPQYHPCCTSLDVERIITFLEAAPTPVLIHCEMGISRSAAATLIAYYRLHRNETQAVQQMLDARERPVVHKIKPNRLMLAYADRLLGSQLSAATRELR